MGKNDLIVKGLLELVAAPVNPKVFVKNNFEVLSAMKLSGVSFRQMAQTLSNHGMPVDHKDLMQWMYRLRAKKNEKALPVGKRTQRAANASVGKFLREQQKAGYSTSKLLQGFEYWKKKIGE